MLPRSRGFSCRLSVARLRPLCGSLARHGAVRSDYLRWHTARLSCGRGSRARRDRSRKMEVPVDWGIVARAVHLLAVVVWIGGVWLVTTVLLPGIKQNPPWIAIGPASETFRRSRQCS